jgi:4-hydroxybenzoate polyprenyltransferase
MLRRLRDILEMIKFSHTVFAMPFAIMAAFLAAREDGGPSAATHLGKLGLVVAAMVTARSAAMAFNRLADVRFDAANPRTATRHLPAGRLTAASVWLFTAAASAGFLAACWGFDAAYGNPWPLRLGVPVLLFVCGYSLAKRFTALAHFWLGASLMIAPVATFIAFRGTAGDIGIRPEAWLIGAAVLFWTAGFDIIYACQDAEFDRAAGLHSVPARLGVAGALWVSRACHVAAVAALVAVGRSADLHLLYWVGVAAAVMLLAYEHSLVGDWRLSRPDLSRVDAAFFTVNGCVSLTLGLLAALDVLFPLGMPLAAAR